MTSRRVADPTTLVQRALAPAFAAFCAVAVLAVSAPPALAAGGTISGVAYQDLNRDGVRQADEPVWSGHRLYLYDGAGTYIGNRTTDTAGGYQFSGLVDGAYRLEYAPASWWAVRENWVPTTSSSLRPTRTLSLFGQATADFGWRPIMRSTDKAAPITQVTAANGLRVASYNDAVAAQTLLDALMSGTLIGDEASHTTVYFGYSGSSSCTTTASQSGGTYTEVQSACYVTYLSWLDSGDRTLFHEYGHAFGHYHRYVVQQDPDLTTYLELRGLTGDSRLDTSHGWSRHEILAEDYRQLFGSANARSGGQMNTEIPLAGQVPGLADYLATTFRTAPAPADPPTGEETPPPGGTPPPTPAPAPVSVHVSDIDGRATALRTGNWRADATVAVRDDVEAVVAGAVVTVAWVVAKGGSGTTTCTTDISGVCGVSANGKKTNESITFTVTGVAASGLAYASADNGDPDGDSDGTRILVNKA